MRLDIKERLVFTDIFPAQSTLENARLIRDMTEKVEFSPEEGNAIELKTAGNQYHWNKEKAKEILDKDVFFSKHELEYLKDRVDIISKEEKVSQSNLSLCNKIKEAEAPKNEPPAKALSQANGDPGETPEG